MLQKFKANSYAPAEQQLADPGTLVEVHILDEQHRWVAGRNPGEDNPEPGEHILERWVEGHNAAVVGRDSLVLDSLPEQGILVVGAVGIALAHSWHYCFGEHSLHQQHLALHLEESLDNSAHEPPDFDCNIHAH